MAQRGEKENAAVHYPQITRTFRFCRSVGNVEISNRRSHSFMYDRHHYAQRADGIHPQPYAGYPAARSGDAVAGSDSGRSPGVALITDPLSGRGNGGIHGLSTGELAAE